MHSQRADCGTGAGVAAGVGDLAFEYFAQSRLDKTPGPHVLRFFLTPDKPGRFWKRFHHGFEFRFREWIKLLDPNDRRVVDLFLDAIIQEIVIKFARTENDSLHLLGRANFGRTENFFEPAAGKFLRARRSEI